MKKAISLSFLLLANIVVLAHAVVPHHYHNQIPVITWNFLLNPGDLSHPSNQCNDPDCSNHEDIGDCLLSNIGMRFGCDKQLLLFHDFNFEQEYFLSPLFSINSTIEINDLEGLPFNPKPYLLSCHNNYISQSSGLRGPP